MVNPVDGEASVLARSTIWRWVKMRGDQLAQQTLPVVLSWIQRANPASQIHRFSQIIPRRKYRSAERYRVLQTGLHLLRALRELPERGGGELITNFATCTPER